MGLLSDVADGVTAMFVPPVVTPANDEAPPAPGLLDTMFGDWKPGGGSPAAQASAFPQYAEDAVLTGVPDQVAAATGEGPTEATPMTEATPTAGAPATGGTANAANGAVATELGAIDWNTDGALEKFRSSLTNVPAADRVALLKTLPAGAQSVGFTALQLAATDDLSKDIAKTALTKTNEDGEVDSGAIDKALSNMRPDVYAKMKGELAPDAAATLEQTEAEHIAKLEEELDDGLAGDGLLGDTRSKEERVKNRIANMPPAMRESVVAAMPEGDARDRATAALDAVHVDEEGDRKHAAAVTAKIEGSTKDFAELATKKRPEAKPGDDPGAIEDAQKKFDKEAAAALAKIPYKDREKAIAEMPEEARAVASAAMDKKREEMKAKAKTLFDAMNSTSVFDPGVDVSTVFQTLATLTPDERKEIEAEYGKAFKKDDGHGGSEARDLESDLRSEFQDITSMGVTTKSRELDRQFISAVFSGDTAEQKAIALQLGARGSTATDFTDEALLKATLASITDPEERAKTFKIFTERQQKKGESDTDVSQMLRSETVTGDVDKNDYEYKQLLALSNGQMEAAKAVEAEEAMDPGMLGKVSVRQIAHAADVLPGGFLISNGIDLADAAGLVDADRKVAEPNTEKVAQIYAGAESQSERDKISANFKDNNGGKSIQEVTSDRCPEASDSLLVDSATKNDKVGVAAGRMLKASEKLNSDEQAILKELEGPDGFGKKVIARVDEVKGEGHFDHMTSDVMNKEELAARDELRDNGKVKPLTGLLAATPKVSMGWAIEDIEKHLHDPADPKKLLSKDAAAQLRKEFCEKQGITEDELEKVANARFGGKDAFRFLQMMKGEPATQAERVARMTEEQEFNREGLLNAPGKWLTDSRSNAGESQDLQYQKALEMQEQNGAAIAELEAKKAAAISDEDKAALTKAQLDGDVKKIVELQKKQMDAMTPDDRAALAKADQAMAEQAEYFGTNVKSYQAGRDTISNDVVTLGAGAVGTLATIMSGGTAAPVIGALLSGLTTIGGRLVLLGDTYNTRDVSKDALQTGVNMLAAHAQIGVGNLIKDGSGGALTALATSAMKGIAGQGASGLVSSAGGVLLDEKTLQGKGDIGDMTKKVLFGTLSSAANGGVSGLLGKGLDMVGLEAADPSKALSLKTHVANKAISTLFGDAAGYVVDPANLSQPDAFGKFIQKELMSLPANIAQAAYEYQMASSPEQRARASGMNEKEARRVADLAKSQGLSAEEAMSRVKQGGANERVALERGLTPSDAHDLAQIAMRKNISLDEAIAQRELTDSIFQKIYDQVNHEADISDDKKYGPEIHVERLDPGVGTAGRPLDEDYVPGPGEKINWGQNNGGIGAPSHEVLPPDLLLERKGLPKGGYLSPENTPIEQRSLPPDYDPATGERLPFTPDEYFYRVGPNGLRVEANAIAPLFGHPGGGVQYQAVKDDPSDRYHPNMDKLVKDGRLIQIQHNHVQYADALELAEMAELIMKDDSMPPAEREALLRELGLHD